MPGKKVKIDLDCIRPNSLFIYPLYSDKDVKILDERVALTPEKMKNIRERYGNIVYYIDRGEGAIIPNYRMNIAYHKSREIMEEVYSTDKLSRATYREAEKVVEEIVTDLNSSEIEAITLLKDLKTHEEYLYNHSVNVGVLAAVFSKMLGRFSREEVKFITLGAYLLDIGSMKIDKQLLNKGGKYNITEMQKVKRHPQLGYEILKVIPNINALVLQTVLFHHEKYNNKGYYNMPYESLPVAPKIVSTCDIYDALTTARPFRDAVKPSHTLKIMVNLINHNFDYALMSDFINYLGPLLNNTQAFYSKNDICELNTHELAIISDFGIHDYLKPKVLVFCKIERRDNRLEARFYERPIVIDLQNDDTRMISKFINNHRQIDTIKSKLVQKNIIPQKA